MKKRTKLQNTWLIAAVAICILALAVGGTMLAHHSLRQRRGYTAKKPDFSAQSVSITYAYKNGSYDSDYIEGSCVGDHWSCGATITDQKTIKNLGKLLKRSLWEQTGNDRKVQPYWRLQMDDAVVTLCRPLANWTNGYRWEYDFCLVYERGGEKTVWELHDDRVQPLSDAIDALVKAPAAEQLIAVQVKRLSDKAEGNLTAGQLEEAKALFDAVLHQTKQGHNDQLSLAYAHATHEVTFVLADGSSLSISYAPPITEKAENCRLVTQWGRNGTYGSRGFFRLNKEYDAFSSLFALLEE